MTTRKVPFENGEFYHVYNRGVDKRVVFEDLSDSRRFLRSMVAFNDEYPAGSLFLHDRLRSNSGSTATELKTEAETKKPLVNIVAYCLNPNHFHLLLEQVSDGGISEFMKRVSGGYTWYFNNKYGRTGSLFQGRFKSVHVESNEYLLHVSVYVNLNARVHSCSDSGSTAMAVSLSSWSEYMVISDCGQEDGICKKDDVLNQFRDQQGYRKFAEHSLRGIREGRGLLGSEYLFEAVPTAVQPLHKTSSKP